MKADVDLILTSTQRRITRPTAWKLALLAGFVTQLLLIVLVTTFGLRQLGMTTDKLNAVVDVHMRKQNLTKDMVIAARERTLVMFMLTKIEDPFERDELLMQFNNKGSVFVTARQALMNMPLNQREQNLIARQSQLVRYAQPIQEQVINLISRGAIRDAENLVLSKVIPAQNDVMEVLSQLDTETQQVALAASSKAREAHEAARFWMYSLSGAALLVGLIVTAIVFYFTSRISRERELLATQDVRTNLPNRRLFLDRLEQAIVRAQRRKTLVGLMFIDLDRFKLINDTLGHNNGDMLIREVAERLRQVARAEDTVARLGGDEFVVIISDAAEISHITRVAEKMLDVITQPYRLAGREIFCSCSIGITVYPNDGETSTSLLKHADTAMYHAKQHGRNRFQLYDKAMNAMAEERLQLETDLHYALERNEFVFHYQPKLNLESGRIQSLEALIRWRHPEKGLLSPAAFLQILEESGVIVSVGSALMKVACSQAADWHAAGFPDLRVAVNVSGKEFWHDDLVQTVKSALSHSGLPARALQLELTEGIFMEDMEAAINRSHELKALGITIAIDDFGTGFSSLAHLKRFPLDVLKVDRYFVKDIQDAPVNAAIFNSILALCKGLGLGIIAEGVETREQLETLRELGCQNVQGYFISRPVPAEQIIPLLERDWSQALAAPA
jgi:diguanylate cyclase (GGDEF)-like protein